MRQDIVDVPSSLVDRSSLSAQGGGYDPPKRNIAMSRIARRQSS